MTSAEALVFLGIEQVEEVEDAFENAVFTIRKQLIAGPVLRKTTEGRSKRLLALEEAYSVLTGEPVDRESDRSHSVQIPDTLPELFTSYHQHKHYLLQQLGSTLKVKQIILIANQLLELESALAAHFTDFADWCDAEVTVGKEADPMLVLKHVREQVAFGRKSVAELYENKNNLPTELLIVLKRLSLLNKFL